MRSFFSVSRATGDAEAVLAVRPATRSNRRATLVPLGLAVIASIALGGCARPDPVRQEVLDSVSGLELIYRFETGRVYRARYGGGLVDFELLEPRQEPPPGARLAYREIRIRPGLHLVSWVGEPKFHVTMLLDLDRNEVHFSALYDGARSVFETAELITLQPIP